MTTNQSSTNAFKYTYKSGLKGLPILPAIASFGVLSFFVLLFSGVELLTRQPIYNSEGDVSGYVSASQKYIALFFEDTEYMLMPCLALVALCGLAMAICTFTFITSKKQVNVFYSLGITRTKLFLGKYLSGVTLLAISIFTPMFIALILNLASLGFSGAVFKIFFLYLFAFLFVSVSAFTITATVFSCVGTIFEAGVFSAIILFLPDILLYGIQTVMGKFLYGNPYGFSFTPVNNYSYNDTYIATLSEQFEFLSPVFFAKSELEKFGVIEKQPTEAMVKQVIENPSFIYIVLWAILAALIAVLGIKLFNKRKAEIAGFIGTNRILNTFVSFLAGFFAFSLAISFVEKVVTGIVLGCLAFTIIHLGLELAVLRDLKKFVRGLYKLPVGLVAVSLFVVSMHTGLFGFSENLPNIERIKSVSVTILGDGSQYALFGDGDMYMPDHNLQFLSAQNIITGELTSETDIKNAIKAHGLISGTPENERTIKNSIQFSYTLKDGTTFKRNFKTVSPEGYKAVLYLEESQYFKNSLDILFNGLIKMPDPQNDYHLTASEEALSNAQFALRDSSSTVNIYSQYLDSFYFATLSDKDREKLLTALYNDLMNRSVTEKYYPETSPVAFIKFEGDFYNAYWASQETTENVTETKKPKTEFVLNDFSSDKVELYTSSFYNPQPFFTITPDMTETIKLLKEFKIYKNLIKTPDFVSAKIIPASVCYKGTFAAEEHSEEYFSRYFITTYTSTSYVSLDEYGNPVSDPWERYNTTIDKMFDGYVTNEIKDVEKLLRYSYSAYEQDSVDSGYFVTFYTSTGDTSLCFIPENRLPQEFKVKL